MIRRRATTVALLASPLLLTGCGGGAAATGRRTPSRPAPTSSRTTPAPTHEAVTRPTASPARPTKREPQPQGTPVLGPRRSATLPERCERAVVVTGRGRNLPLSRVSAGCERRV
ncbi:hypothetical protein JK359_22420 [Streptomyces actinomycinicus]|uniref:Lipoprotein n=1 Tax=Streptomyces actinomycinicus TaxID=1695166 RepID=A0A937ELY4_9ACTN|nr:hypothetical protein [Streptomyces actinomycinicus]MBL1084690.1 hypothetical protein [Streptomyces actinomycinicus]